MKQINNKKIFVFSIFIIFVCSSLFAIPPLNIDKTSDMWNNNWDLPIIESIVLFGGSLYNFMYTARKFCIFFFFLNICWQSFKLWFGTIEIKKVAIDILIKYLLVTTLMTVYPSLVDGVFSIASNIGIGNTGAAAYLTDQIGATFQSSYEASLASVSAISQSFKDGNLKNIKKEDLNKLAKGLAMEPEELEGIFQNELNGYKTDNYKWTWGSFLGTVNKFGGGGVGVAAGLVNAVLYQKNKKEYEKIFTEAVSEYDVSNMFILFDTFNNSFGISEINAEAVKKILNGEATTEQIDATIQEASSRIRENIKSYFTSPFMDIPYTYSITNSVGKTNITDAKSTFKTSLLSPSQMLRLGIMLARVVENKSKIGVEKHTNKNGELEGYYSDNKILNFTEIKIAELFNCIIKFIFPFLMLIPVIVCVVNYVVCMLEYYLVTSIGILFIPMLLFDPLKQYGSKLLNLFFSYFLKVMTISIINYFCLALLLKSGTYLMLNPDTFSFQCVGYAIFIFVLSLVLSQGAPELGQVLLSGNPSLNAGHVARTGHQMAHALRTGSNVAHKVEKGAEKAAVGGAKAVAGGYMAGKTLVQNRQAVAAQADKIFKDSDGNWRGSSEEEKNANKNAAHEYQKQTNKQMFTEDVKQRVGSKFGFTMNNKNNRERAVGGIGQKDANGHKIDGSMNKEFAKGRAEQAYNNFIGRNDNVDKKPSSDSGDQD